MDNSTGGIHNDGIGLARIHSEDPRKTLSEIQNATETLLPCFEPMARQRVPANPTNAKRHGEERTADTQALRLSDNRGLFRGQTDGQSSNSIRLQNRQALSRHRSQVSLGPDHYWRKVAHPSRQTDPRGEHQCANGRQDSVSRDLLPQDHKAEFWASGEIGAVRSRQRDNRRSRVGRTADQSVATSV